MLGGYLRKKWIKFLKEYFSFKSLGTCCLLPGFVYMFLSHWANKQAMVNSLYETLLQRVMVAVSMKTNIHSKIINTTAMIHCSASQRELTRQSCGQTSWNRCQFSYPAGYFWKPWFFLFLLLKVEEWFLMTRMLDLDLDFINTLYYQSLWSV